MAEDFRKTLRTIFEDEPSSRFIYMGCNSRHYIICQFADHDTVATITTLIEAMRDNQGLLVMREDTDYCWEGASMISFRKKEHAALFYLCCPH